jgi:hypothetical protein
MTHIKLERSTKEYKRGFRNAMKMIQRWCESGNYRSPDELGEMIKASLFLDDLMKEKE